jgi:hypothetical protein
LNASLNGTLSDTSATITAFNGVAGVTYHIRCLGAGSITYHATDLIITQGLASITTAAGDTFDVEMLTATTCRVKNYIYAIQNRTFIGNFTRDLTAATGSVQITGVGFKPRKITFFGRVNGTASSSNGISNDTGNFSNSVTHDPAVGYEDNTKCLAFTTAVGSYQTAIATMGANGFTLEWTKTGTPTGTAIVGYIAEE